MHFAVILNQNDYDEIGEWLTYMHNNWEEADLCFDHLLKLIELFNVQI